MARETFPEVPPRVEYALTDKGRALVPIIESMRAYGSEWLGADGSCARARRAGRRRRIAHASDCKPPAARKEACPGR